MAQIRQLRPGYGLGSQVKVLNLNRAMLARQQQGVYQPLLAPATPPQPPATLSLLQNQKGARPYVPTVLPIVGPIYFH